MTRFFRKVYKIMEKIKSDLVNLTCTQKALAEAIGISAARVNQLIEEKVVAVDESDKQGAVFVVSSLRNYYLSKNAAGSGVDFWKEKGLHERAKRQLAELKVRQSEGELYIAAEVEQTYSEILTVLRNNLLGLPSKLAAQLEGKSREEIFQSLTQEIESDLEQLVKSG